MMNFVVDTNIVFSAILSPNGKIHDLLLNSEGTFSFFTPTFLLEELEKHHSKLKKISGFGDAELNFAKRIVFRHLEFIDPEIIRKGNWKKAIELVSRIDENDIPFVALALEIEGKLWSGDKKLKIGLEKRESNIVLTSNDLHELRQE